MINDNDDTSSSSSIITGVYPSKRPGPNRTHIVNVPDTMTIDDDNNIVSNNNTTIQLHSFIMISKNY